MARTEPAGRTPALPVVRQSPIDPDFVQDPYPFYAASRIAGPLVFWQDYGLPATTTFAATNAILRDRRFGRQRPADRAEPVPDRLKPFYAIEAHSMLELEPPRHTRLRGAVLQAFTSRRIRALAPAIEALCHDLIDRFPTGPFDLLAAYARPLPVTVIADLLGVPRDRTADLLAWSNAMVAMYQAGRSRQSEDDAVAAARSFDAYIRALLDERAERSTGDDLLGALVSAEGRADALDRDEIVSTAILLLNAGHEATVHTLGNGVKALIGTGGAATHTAPERIEASVEEILRHDPPLHLFTRYAYERVEIDGHTFEPGDEVACLLAAANRDPALVADPDRFDPTRRPGPHAAFGAGIHFCLGAPLARLELQIALRVLFKRCPDLALAAPPRYAPIYHFHGLDRLEVTTV